MKHLIGKQILAINMKTGEKAFDLSNKLSGLFWQRIVPILENLFDQYSNEHELVRIDRLEIDLGQLTENQLLEGRFLQDLKRLLELELAKLNQASPLKKEYIPMVRNHFEQWLFFLEKGYLPWSASKPKGDWLRNVLDSLATTIQAVEQFRNLISRDKVAAERLVLQHSTTFLKTIVELNTGKKQDYLIQAVEEIRSLIVLKKWIKLNVRLLSLTPRQFELFFWQRIIEEVISSRKRLEGKALLAWFLVKYYTPAALIQLLATIEEKRFPTVIEALELLDVGKNITEATSEKPSIDHEARGSTIETPTLEEELPDLQVGTQRQDTDRESKDTADLGHPTSKEKGAEPVRQADGEHISEERTDQSSTETRVDPMSDDATAASSDVEAPASPSTKEEQERAHAPNEQVIDAAEDAATRSDVDQTHIDATSEDQRGKAKEREETLSSSEDNAIVGSTENKAGTPDISGKAEDPEKESRHLGIVEKTLDKLAGYEEAAETDSDIAQGKLETPSRKSGPVSGSSNQEKEEEGQKESNEKIKGEQEIPAKRKEDPAQKNSSADPESIQEKMAFSREDLSSEQVQDEELPAYLKENPAPPYYEVQADEELYINNAGIVLVHPFLSRYFDNLGLLKKRKFKDEKARHRAIRLLHFLATGDGKTPEYDLMLPKILTGLPINVPLDHALRLTKKQKSEGEAMLEALIEHWGVLGSTSPEGLREGFLQREGKLIFRNGSWQLKIEQQTLDLLLDRLPWGVGIIKLPWMMDMLQVEWRH